MKKFLLIIPLILFHLSFALHGSTKDLPKKAPEIKGVITEEGKPFSLQDYRGKVLIVTYGYTHCPHVCPTLTAFLKKVETKLNQKGLKGKYKIIFITVDPKLDTPERLKKYKTEKGFTNWVFLTGDKNSLKKIWKDYNVFVQDKGYMEMKHGDMVMKHRMINHTAKVTIIDKKGNIVEEFKTMYLPVEEIVEDVEKLIKEN
ncbi:MAG: SCO family protein [Aquificae bacterium]|nr:SCO family protein [Aquificota bacterium]